MIDSDGTVIFSMRPVLTGGSKRTAAFAAKHLRPPYPLSGLRYCVSLWSFHLEREEDETQEHWEYWAAKLFELGQDRQKLWHKQGGNVMELLMEAYREAENIPDCDARLSARVPK